MNRLREVAKRVRELAGKALSWAKQHVTTLAACFTSCETVISGSIAIAAGVMLLSIHPLFGIASIAWACLAMSMTLFVSIRAMMMERRAA